MRTSFKCGPRSWRDLRLAFRSLRATPIVTAIAMLSLALGIGANTAIFSIVNKLLLRSLPVRDPARLVLLTEGTTTRPRTWSFPVWEQIRRRPELFANGCVVIHAVQSGARRRDSVRGRPLG